MRYEEVPIRAVDLREERFRTSREGGPEGLIRSIRETGLLSPPVVIRQGRRYVLVTGWKRALACRALGFRTMPVLVTEEKDDLRLLLTALSENLATRELSLAEKAVFVKKLGQMGMSLKTLTREYMPRFGLPPTAAHLHVMLSLAEAGRAVLAFVSDKAPSSAVVKALFRFPPSDQKRLLPLLRALGQNKQKQLLEDLWESGRRDKVPLERLFRRAEFRRTLGESRLSMPQKAERIRQLARKRRHPGLSACEESFRSALRRMRWPRDISVQPSAGFEEDRITVSFRVGSREEFREILDKLEEMAGRDALADLFRGNG